MKTYRTASLAMVAACFAPGPAPAGTYPIASFDCLQGTIVRDVRQDSRGFMWLATDSGLWRWEPNGFRSLAERIPSAAPAWCLLEGTQRKLWVGTSDGLLAVDIYTLDVVHPTRRQPILDGKIINCLYRDWSGVIWIGTGRGLYHLERKDGSYSVRSVPATHDYCIRSLTEDGQGGLWVGADRALMHLADWQVSHECRDLVGTSCVRTLLHTRDGSLWIGLRNRGGLYRFHNGRASRITRADGLGNDEVNVILEAPDGALWFGTEDGVFRWNGSTFLSIDRRSGLNNTDVHSLFMDRERQLWIGTYGSGVQRVRSLHVLTYGLEDGLRHPMVTALARDLQGRLVIGTINGAMYFDPSGPSGERIGPPLHVWRIHVARTGEVWLAGPGGFARAGDSAESRMLGHVNAVGEDHVGRILLGTGRGLWRFEDGDLNRVTLPAGASDEIHAIFRASDGSVYVGTQTGLVRGGGGGGWEILSEHGGIKAIGEGWDGRLLLATDGMIVSVSVDKPTEPVSTLSDVGHVRGFTRGRPGEVWAATDDGILRLQGNGTARFTCRHGLPSRDVRCALFGDDGKLYAGTTQGLAEMDSHRLEPCRVAPRVAIDRVFARGNEWTAGLEGLELPYVQRDLMIESLHLGWRSAEGVCYQYRLVGHDDDWSAPTTLGIQRYTGLPVGDYTFCAKAINGEGLESNIATFAFTVLPPFWHRPWFLGLAALTVFLIGLTMARLYVKRKQLSRAAEAASEAKRQFLSRMSHEIRTPLTVILACAERLSARDLPHAARAECADAVMHNGRHLLQLVNDVLDISKIRDGKMQIARVPCDLREMLTGIESLATHRASGKGIDFELEIDRAVPGHIVTDPTKLRQLLINLLDNAIKFTDSGVVRLRISSRVANGRAMLRLAVEDTGVGIPPDQKTAIFEAFRQADSTGGGRRSGTGLGLSISKAIADLLGGTLGVSSEPGRGSVFVAELPLVLSDAPAVASEAASAPGGPIDPRTKLANVEVLLADDCADINRVLEVMLGEAGARVEAVSTGREVVSAALAHRYDILLLDIHMPDMDGLAVMRRLRRHGVTLPAVAVTADATDGIRQLCLEAGFEKCVAKPFTRAEVLSAIRTVIGQSQRGGDDGNGRHGSHAAHSRREPAEHHTKPKEPIRSSLASQSPRLAEAAADFVRSLDETVRLLEDALQGRDTDVLAQIAHRLKGSGGVNGYMCISRQAKELEHAIDQRDFRAAADHVAALESLRQSMIDGLTVDAPG